VLLLQLGRVLHRRQLADQLTEPDWVVDCCVCEFGLGLDGGAKAVSV